MAIDSWVGHELDGDESVGLTIHAAGNRHQFALTPEQAHAVGSFMVEESEGEADDR